MKPTFIQSLLNQPSQSYANSDSHTHHQQRSMPPPQPPQQLKPPPPTAYRRRLSYNELEDLELSEESDLEDLFFTPNTSPRTSMASSHLMFPTGRKPSRRSLRLSDSSDIAVLAAATRSSPPSSPTTARPIPTSTSSAVLSTRTPSTTTQKRQHPPAQNQRNTHALSTTSSLSATSLEPLSVLSDYVGSVEPLRVTSPTTNLDDKNKGKGITKRTRHGLVTIPSTTTQTESAKSTTTSKRKNSLADGDVTRDFKRPMPAPSSSPPHVPVTASNGSATSKRKNSQQGVADGDLTKDVKRFASTPTSSPPPTSTSNGSAVTTTFKQKNSQPGLADGDPTKDAKRSVPNPTSPPPPNSMSDVSAAPVKPTTTTSSTTVGPPHVLASRRSSKTQTSTNAGAASSKEKTTPDVVVETEVPSAKEKGKEVDSSTSKLKMKDKGKERANPIPVSTPTPHTFSAFAPLTAAPLTAPSTPPANGSANSSNNKPSLPPAGFSFPPPPPHSPSQQVQQPQPQQPKTSFSGSAAAYTYANRQKSSSSPKLSGVSGSSSIMRNMAALLEEDEVAEGGDGSTPSRKLRRVYNGNGNGNGQGKGKGKEKRMSDSTSDSSHHSYSALPSHSNVNSPLNPHFESVYRSPPKTLASEVNAMSLSTPGELPSKGTQGYTSLVLPRAPLPLGPHSTIRSASSGSGSRKWFGNVGKEGKIDLTRSGVAQTTMASVEVVRGLGRQQGHNGFGGKLMGMLRKRSVSGGTAGPRPIEGLGKPVDDVRTVKEDLPTKRAPTTAGVHGTVLGFTSYRKPPGYIPSSSVLVQVWAVGVDGVDGRLVGVNFGDYVWRERGMGGYETEEGVETEWEREVQKGEESEDVDVSRSTPQQASSLSGLGRSFSLKMSRKQRGSVVAGQQQELPQARGRTPSLSKSFSLKRNNTTQSSSQSQQHTLIKSSSQRQAQRQKMLQKTTHRAEVGYIPGRSFVGRVLECGWDVRDEDIRKGEWVVGLLDIKKCGALTEFIVVDRHRIHRVPHPRKSSEQQGNGLPNMAAETPFQDDNILTLEELALLPLCGIPAYRAVRTLIYAFSSLGEGGGMTSPIIAHERKFGITGGPRMTATEHPQDRRRRVLVLRGHDGVGAMAVQILAKRGWKVSVHVPFSASSTNDPAVTGTEHGDRLPGSIQERARDWGADEIIFDEEVGDGIDDGRIAAIRVIESLREDGDVFDAILDTVGGREVREAGERLLKSAGGVTNTPSVYGGFPEPSMPRARRGVGQFTTLVGDVPERPIPTTADLFRAGLRSFGAESGNRNDEGTADMRGNKVGYAWVSVAQDVDWEGEDIGETLSSVLRLALEERVRPVIGAPYRVVPFEQAPHVFVDRGPLGHGCNVVVKIAG